MVGDCNERVRAESAIAAEGSFSGTKNRYAAAVALGKHLKRENKDKSVRDTGAGLFQNKDLHPNARRVIPRFRKMRIT